MFRLYEAIIRLRTTTWKYVIHLFASIHSVFCLTTGPKPPPNRLLNIVRCRASSFKWEYPLLSLRSSSSFLCLMSIKVFKRAPNCTAAPVQSKKKFIGQLKSVLLEESFYSANDFFYYDMIYLLTAIGLSPSGKSRVRIYTQTTHRTIQNKQYIEQHNNFGRVRAVPWLGYLYPCICLTTEEKARKNLSQGSRV